MFDYMPFTNSTTPTQKMDYGAFSLYNMTDAPVIGTNNVSQVTVRLGLEDVELIGAGIRNPDAFAWQSGIADKEARPISTLLSGVSKVATVMSMVPNLRALAAPAAWVTGVLAGTARAFGYSKPLAIEANVRTFHSSHNYISNVDGPDTSYNLGATVDNKLTPLPGFVGTDIDEMAIDYIVTRPGHLCTFAYNKTNVRGTPLWGIPICPTMMYSCRGQNHNNTFPSTTGIAKGAIWPTPVMYMANAFKYWRGGFRFTFTAVKTQYHTGRLLITLVNEWPLTKGYLLFPSANAAYTMPSTVWDLEASDSVTFDVPYLAPVDYCLTEEGTGTIVMCAESPLICPPSVSDTIQIFVTVQAMEGFELSVPTPCTLQPAPIDSVIQYQSGISEAQECIGEKLLSIKQLINQVQPYIMNPTPFTPTYVTPWYKTRNAFWNGAFISFVDTTCAEYFSYMYAYARGGTRISVKATAPSVVSVCLDKTSPSLIMNACVSELSEPVHTVMPFYRQACRARVSSTNDNYIYNVKAAVTISPIANYSYPTLAVIYRGAAEDSQLGYFIGAPPLALPCDTGLIANVPPMTALNSPQTDQQFSRYLTGRLAGTNTVSGAKFVPIPVTASTRAANIDPSLMQSRMMPPHPPVDLPLVHRYQNYTERHPSAATEHQLPEVVSDQAPSSALSVIEPVTYDDPPNQNPTLSQVCE